MLRNSGRPMAAHVQAAIANAAQPRMAVTAATSVLAPHVQRAVVATGQPRMQPGAAGEPAAHVLQTVAPAAQPQLGVGAGPDMLRERQANVWTPSAGHQHTIQRAQASQSTAVTLRFIDGGDVFTIEGRTGRDCGHAEMDALQIFIEQCESVDAAIKMLKYYQAKGRLTVQCEAKPVCSQCTTVLQGLGFVPYDGNTKWGDKHMGSTEWHATQKVQKLINGVVPGLFEKAKKA